jgi:hypothetical protein
MYTGAESDEDSDEERWYAMMEDAALSDPIIEPVKEYNPNSSQLPGGYVFGCIYIYIYML